MCYDRVAEQFVKRMTSTYRMRGGMDNLRILIKARPIKILVEDIHDICIINGLKGVILVGHSMGGVETASFAASYPDLVKGIVLEDPGFSPKTNPFLSFFITAAISLFVRHQDHPKPLVEFEKRSKKFNSKWIERDQLVWAKAQREFSSHYPSKNTTILLTGDEGINILPKVDAPILLVTSQHGVVSKKNAKIFQSVSKNLQWQFIPNAGHNLKREQFDLYVNVLKTFILGLNSGI